MSDYDKGLMNILTESGTISSLRQKIIALLLVVEEIRVASGEQDNEDMEQAYKLIEKLELLLNEFSMSQKIADRILAGLSPEQRKHIQKEAPELFDIFGWHDKVGEKGELKDVV